MTNSQHPIACSLTTKDAAKQSLEWADLQRYALTAERIDHGAVMTFDAELAGQVGDLAAREMLCCDFLFITTFRTDGEIRLEMTADESEAIPVIEALAGVAAR